MPRVRPQFPLWQTLRMSRAPRDTWYFRAAGLVVSGLISLALLILFDRLDLATYTLAGTMTGLFTHALPYPRRALTLGGFVVMLAVVCGVAMAAAAISENMVWRIVVASVLAAIIKVAHEASYVGAPSPVIPIFLATALAFTPQTMTSALVHTAVIAGAGAITWLVLLAPALVRRDGPERRAVASAVLATIPVGKDPNDRAARSALAASISAARRILAFARGRNAAALEAHVVACERVLVDPSLSTPDRAAANARSIERSRTAVPAPPLTEAERAEIRGAHMVQATPRSFAERHPIIAAFGPHSPRWPFFWRMLVAALLSGFLSWACGAERPFWAITAAAVIVQPNLLLTWFKAPPRALGALVGVWLFALLVPVAHTHVVTTVLMVLALNTLAELFIVRSYFVGQIFVTPMALLISQLGSSPPTWDLVFERSIDTVIGVAMGLLAAFAIRNGHLRRHATASVERLEAVTDRIPESPDHATALRIRSELISAQRRAYEALAGLG
jgi:hypothetical protein